MRDQDILDIITDTMWLLGIDAESVEAAVLLALRGAGYAVLRCECVPNTAADPNPNCPIYTEAANHGRQ